MKNSFIRLLLRDIKNYIRTNRFFLIAEAALFLIACMIADMQKPDSYGKYTTIQYYMQIFPGLLSVYGCQNRSVSGSTYMVYTHVLFVFTLLSYIRFGTPAGRHSCSAAGKEQSLVVVQQMSCANRVESALLCSRLFALYAYSAFLQMVCLALPFCRMMYCLAML